MPDQSIELSLGQPVPFPHAPGGLAQVGDLLRSNVELLYERDGRVCRRRVPARSVAGWIRRTPLLPCVPHNPLGRGCLRRTKRFEL